MKKLLVLVFAAVALSASAAWRQVATVQVADTAALIQGVSKFGELTGNLMLGTMAAGAVAEMPGVELFGPARERTPMAFCLFVDDEAVVAALADEKELADPDNLWSLVLVYPVAQTKAAFMKGHEGCVESNGVLRVVLQEEDGVEDVSYVAFSKDGQWAAASERLVVAKAAVEDIRLVARPMKGDLVRLTVTSKGMDVVRQVLGQGLAKERAKLDKDDQKSLVYLQEVLKGVANLVIGASIDDAGLSIRSCVGAVKGTELAKCGLKTLEADPLAFAPKSSLAVSAYAADCGNKSVDVAELLKVLAKYGIKTESFLKIDSPAPNTSVFTFDPPAAVAFCKTLTNRCEKVDEKALKKDLMALIDIDGFCASNPAMACAVAFKGYEAPVTPTARFAAILPEVAKGKLYSAQVFSVYSCFKAVLPLALAEMSAEERAACAPFLAMLATNGTGGIAVAGWREQDKLNGIIRISAGEIKDLSGIFSAVTAYQLQQAMKKAQRQSEKKK